MNDSSDRWLVVLSVLASAVAAFVLGPWLATASGWALVVAGLVGFCGPIALIVWNSWE